jgi:glycosyltransferase involved in cell wall biosynthesis
MRILNVIMCLDPVAGGGAVERVYQLGKHLALAGEECTILTTRQGWDEAYVRMLGDVRVIGLPCISSRFWISLSQTRWLREHLAEFDVTHLGLTWTVVNALTYLHLRRLGRPYVMSGMGMLGIGGRSRLLKHAYKAAIGRQMVRQATACIAITNREIADYVSYGVDPVRIVKIPNGISPELFCDKDDEAFRARYKLDSRPIILFLGRLDPIKGPDLLLKAFHRVSESFSEHQLVIAGNDNGFLPELKVITRSLGIEGKTSFLGPIHGVEKSWAYHAADVFVIPSRYDNMTIVALEAAVSGTPVLLTDRCDFPELQEAGAGLIVECSVEGLANGLRELLSDPVRLRAMGHRAQEFVRSNYNWNHICKQFIQVFRAACLPTNPELQNLGRGESSL